MIKGQRFVSEISIYFATFIVPSTWHDAPITIKHKHFTTTPWYWTRSHCVAVLIQVLNRLWHYSIHTTVLLTNTYLSFIAKYDFAHFNSSFLVHHCIGFFLFTVLNTVFLSFLHTYIYFYTGSSFNRSSQLSIVGAFDITDPQWH